eukprot:Clim_evm11s4 gene=Clim_evmTU11s4
MIFELPRPDIEPERLMQLQTFIFQKSGGTAPRTVHNKSAAQLAAGLHVLSDRDRQTSVQIAHRNSITQAKEESASKEGESKQDDDTKDEDLKLEQIKRMTQAEKDARKTELQSKLDELAAEKQKLFDQLKHALQEDQEDQAAGSKEGTAIQTPALTPRSPRDQFEFDNEQEAGSQGTDMGASEAGPVTVPAMAMGGVASVAAGSLMSSPRGSSSLLKQVSPSAAATRAALSHQGGVMPMSYGRMPPSSMSGAGGRTPPHIPVGAPLPGHDHGLNPYRRGSLKMSMDQPPPAEIPPSGYADRAANSQGFRRRFQSETGSVDPHSAPPLEPGQLPGSTVSGTSGGQASLRASREDAPLGSSGGPPRFPGGGPSDRPYGPPPGGEDGYGYRRRMSERDYFHDRDRRGPPPGPGGRPYERDRRDRDWDRDRDRGGGPMRGPPPPGDDRYRDRDRDDAGPPGGYDRRDRDYGGGWDRDRDRYRRGGDRRFYRGGGGYGPPREPRDPRDPRDYGDSRGGRGGRRPFFRGRGRGAPY